MSLFGAFDQTKHLDELDDPLVTQEGVLTPATRRARVLANLGVTATAAEINAIAGAGLSAGELGVLDGVTAGTVTASKAVVVDANKDIGSLRHLTITGNLVTGATTLSEAELGVLDSAANTNAVAAKAAILGTAGALALGGEVTAVARMLPAHQLITDNQNQVVAASYAVSHTIHVNDSVSGTYKVVGVSAVFGTTSTSGTLQVEVATGTQAVASGTNQLTGTMSLSGTANTVVNGTVIGSPTTVSAGARINLIFAGTVTNLANAAINVVLQRLS